MQSLQAIMKLYLKNTFRKIKPWSLLPTNTDYMYLKFVSATSASSIQLPTRHLFDYPLCHVPTHTLSFNKINSPVYMVQDISGRP